MSTNNSRYIAIKDLPQVVQSTLKSLGYCIKDISVKESTTVSLYSSAGDGYRAFASVLNTSTGEVKTNVGSWGGANPWSQNNLVDTDESEFEVSDDVVIIQGYSGGSSGTVRASITISPTSTSIPKSVTASVGSLADEQLEVLNVIRSFTSAYRKSFLAGKDAIVDSLVASGHLKRSKNGAVQISLTGKNAVLASGKRCY
jgi:hypothetical protein